MKSAKRWSKASGSTKRRVEAIVALGERFTRRRFRAVDRAALRAWVKGGWGEN